MITNFFRIHLPLDSFQIQQIPYADGKLESLKKEYNAVCSFFRHGDFIYASPAKESDVNLGETATLRVADSPHIVLSLIRHLVFRGFRSAMPHRIPQSFSPLRFFSTRAEHDPIRALLPPELQKVVSYPRMIEVEARQIDENGKPTFGLLVRIRHRWQFNVSLEEIVSQGFDLIGKSVLETQVIADLQGVLAPDESLLGEVLSLNDSTAEISTNEGVVQRPIASLQLQRTRNQIGAYFAFKLGEARATQIFKKLQEFNRDRQSPDYSFYEIQRTASWFTGTSDSPRLFENSDGFCFQVTSDSSFQNSSVPLYKTKLVFDYGPGASASSPLTGLASYGPFNAARFERNNLKLLAICHPHTRGAVSHFLKCLVDGIPESRYFTRGLRSLFHLTTVDTTVKEVKNSFADSYEEAIDDAVKDSDNRGFDIALVACPEIQSALPHNENPYYRARARLMSYGIPTQGVRAEHLRKNQESLQWTLGPMALQIYAKTGGTPWRLPASQSVDREILVGIGSTLDRPNLWAGAEQSRIVGITTFFLGDGSYVLGERLRTVPYSEYFAELLQSLRTSIGSLADEYAWNPGDSVRIVFHIFKPIKNVEADVVTRLISEFPQFNITFAFVTVSTEHPWVMFRSFSHLNQAPSATLCERGDNLLLDSNHCLLQVRGNQDRPNKKQRPPYPLSIRLHEKSTFTDIKYIMQQIQDFTYLSWRSFFPAEIPVTIFYSSLIASEFSKLAKLPGWNPGFIDKHFRRKQWFL